MAELPKYPSTGHWPHSLTVHRDDTYHRNAEHFVGKEVVITEKLDGGNTSLHNGEVYARSTVGVSHAGWMGMVRKHHAWKTSGMTRYMIYGEDIAAFHSLPYSVPEDQTYHVFAIRDLVYMDWLSWDDVVATAAQYNLTTAPLLFRGTFESVDAIQQWFTANLKLPSAFGNEKEGFVMRIADAFHVSSFSDNVCKFVRPKHVQTDQHWTKNWQWNELTRGNNAG